MAGTKGVKALRLTLGGAPDTWHTVVGLPGWFHTQIPVPVGGPGDPPLELAESAAKDDGCPVVLVHISDKDADEARQAVRDLAAHAAVAVRTAARDGVDEQVQAEHAAVASVDETKE